MYAYPDGGNLAPKTFTQTNKKSKNTILKNAPLKNHVKNEHKIDIKTWFNHQQDV